MPYFQNDVVNLLFIHIPKTGGTSVEFYLSKKYNIPLDTKSLFMFLDEETAKNNNVDVNVIRHPHNGCNAVAQNDCVDFNKIPKSSLQHITYKTIFKYKDFFNINENNLDIFTIVRNPYERVVSDLFFLSKNPSLTYASFHRINKNTSKDEVYNIIKKYLSEDVDNHNIPQYLFITDDNNELIPNIKILKTETLQNDMSGLGYEDFNLNENVNSNKVDYYEYLNNDSIKLINDFYDYDFKLFNYDKRLQSHSTKSTEVNEQNIEHIWNPIEPTQQSSEVSGPETGCFSTVESTDILPFKKPL